jgi:membrane protein DedA with SNARE-associated domain
MHEISIIFREVLTAVNQGHPIAFLVMVGLTALTEVGIPTLGLIDAVLLYVGYQFGLFSIRAVIIIALLTLGRIFGSAVIYWPSRVLGKSFINWLERHFPSVRTKITQVVGRLSRRQALAVVIVRFTPGLLTSGTVAAGMLKINYKDFLLGVVIHSVIADVVLILIGYLGKYGVTLAGINPKHWQVITAAMVLVLGISAGLFFYQRLKARKKRKKSDKVCESDQSRG